MAVRTSRRRPTIRGFIEEDARVVALEGFRPVMGQMIERGTYYRLSDPIVRQFPAFFAALVPVPELLGEIERAGE